MKFTAVVAIVPEDMEQACLDRARELGAGGITVLQGRGISNETRKTFFGFAYDGSQSVLLMVLERQLSLEVLKAIDAVLCGDNPADSRGLVFSVPLEHLRGMDMAQFHKFERHLKDRI